MTKIKVQVESGFPITLLTSRWVIGSERQGDGWFYPVLTVWGSIVLSGREELWIFHAPICSWSIVE